MTEKIKVLYIHGFMSGANSMTLRKLKKDYEYIYDFIVPELTGDPEESLTIVNDIIKNEKPSLIIGSSLGGFYALVCDSGNIPIIVVNPCVDPYRHMQQYLDKELKYHSKRNDGKTTYVLTKDIIERFRNYDLEKCVKSKIRYISIVVSDNDEILGDSHYNFFKRIKKEMKLPRLFMMVGSFGHRAYPFGMSDLNTMIYDVMWP